jgi:hypothetical protein
MQADRHHSFSGAPVSTFTVEESSTLKREAVETSEVFLATY